MGSQTRKILLIGATGYERAKDGLRLDCANWDKLHKIANVRDYDVLVLNLLSLSTEAEREKVDWIKFNELLDFCAATDILIHGGRIIVLGDPRFSITKIKGLETKPFLDWTGANFTWDDQPGDTVKVNDPSDYVEFGNYVKNLHRWNYSLAGCLVNKAAIERRWNIAHLERQGVFDSIHVFAACANRYGHALAFRLCHRIGDKYQVKIGYGSLYFLPEISLDEDETMLIVLRDFCDAASELPEPEWVSPFDVPGQQAIDGKISQIKATLVDQQSALESALAERTKVRRCLKLLYEREFALEPVVRGILGELGATVEDPVEKNKEDGWITIEVAGKKYEGVRWTPLFGPKNAEIKLGFQALHD